VGELVAAMEEATEGEVKEGGQSMEEEAGVGEMEEEVKGKLMSAQRPSSHVSPPALKHRGCRNDRKRGHKDRSG
jgi:hypothetical protein